MHPAVLALLAVLFAQDQGAPVKPVRVGFGTANPPPNLLNHVVPTSPLSEMGTPGFVILEVTVGADGRVEASRVLNHSRRSFEDAARDAVMKWRYEPLRLEGKERPFVMIVALSFSWASNGSPGHALEARAYIDALDHKDPEVRSFVAEQLPWRAHTWDRKQRAKLAEALRRIMAKETDAAARSAQATALGQL